MIRTIASIIVKLWHQGLRGQLWIEAVVAVLCVPVLVHALPVPRKIQEQLLPPAQYDHDYDGTLFLSRMPMAEITFLCRRALAPGQATTLGCSQITGRSCRVMIATDEELKQHGFDYDIVYRHEIGHCNGWIHERK